MTAPEPTVADVVDTASRSAAAQVADKLDELDELATMFESDPTAAALLRRYVADLRAMLGL